MMPAFLNATVSPGIEVIETTEIMIWQSVLQELEKQKAKLSIDQKKQIANSNNFTNQFTNLSLMEFQFRTLTLLHYFSVIDSFGWFWVGSLHKNIQIMLEFLMAPFFVLHFSYNILMTFLMMLSAIFLSMLMVLLSTLSVIRHLICGSNSNGLLNFSLIYEILQSGIESDLLISMMEKLNWFRLIGLITLMLLIWKWMSLFLRKNHLLRCWGLLYLLNWIGTFTLSLLLNLPLIRL